MSLVILTLNEDGTIETAKRLYPGVRIVIEKRRGKGVTLINLINSYGHNNLDERYLFGENEL